MGVQVHGLDKLITLAEVAEQVERGARQDLRKVVRGTLEPVVPDAQAGFSRMRGPGPKAARTVRMRASGDKVTLSVGSSSVPTALPSEFGVRDRGTRNYEWRNQFGKGIAFGGTKRIDYRSSFGPYTGTRGKAFLPAVRRGLRRANRESEQLAREWVERLARGA